MARKRFLFFYQYKSILNSVLGFIGLILLGVILSLSSQVLVSHSVKAASPGEIVQQETDHLLKTGLNFYQLEQYQTAITSWESALKIYQAQQQRVQQALTLNYLALAYQKLGQIQASERALQQAFQQISNTQNRSLLARLYNTQGQLQLATGKAEEAFEAWEKAIDFYQQMQDQTGQIGALMNQAQALQELGLYQRAFKLLQSVQEQLEVSPNQALKIKGFRSLGNAYRLLGKLDDSSTVLSKSLDLSTESQDQALSFLSLGNTAFALGNDRLPPPSQILEQNPWETFCNRYQFVQNQPESLAAYQKALKDYSQAATISLSNPTQVEAKVNFTTVAIISNQSVSSDELENIQQQLQELPSSRSNLYTKIHFARNLYCYQPTHNQKIVGILEKTIQAAQSVGDRHAESYGLGNLGSFYEVTGEKEKAVKFTREALAIAQSIFAEDISYQWNWQLGRIFTQTPGNEENAIAFYRAAYQNLQNLRNDLVSLNPNLQFTFRESVEPVYRKYVDLLLPVNASEVSQETLEMARNVIESLQLAEINNFFREACLNTTEVQVDQIDRNAAAIYPIILPERLVVIFSKSEIPDNSETKLSYHYKTIKQSDVESLVNDLRRSLVRVGDTRKVQDFSSNLYQWLIQPFEANLTGVKTLVFVLDGVLRNIPMGVLYNQSEEKYLVQKYAIATAPGLNLVEPQPLPRNLKVLLAGLSEERPPVRGMPITPLKFVVTELQNIKSLVPHQFLLNNQPLFNVDNLQKIIQSDRFNIVHLATHGRFSSDPKQTFIATWEDPIDIENLDNLLRNNQNANLNQPIELLVLSACETAEGDSRAALGLAGVSLRAGAKSTLATLWQVDDESTSELMTEFYQQLINHPNISKAEALQMAQRNLLNTPRQAEKEWFRPYYWAAYVIVGNWL